MKTWTLLLTVALLAVITAGYAAKPKWDYFILSQSWPGSLCMTKTCNERAPGSSWVIHGLWPQRSDGTWPMFCSGFQCKQPDELCGAEFVANKINDLVPQLEQVWPDILVNQDPGNADFWRYEFRKHGTCAYSPNIKNEHDYFSQALKLQKQLDLPTILKGAGITPGETYPASSVLMAIKAVTKKTPQLTCLGDELTLKELRVCYDKNLAYIHCDPVMYRSRCGRTIYLPMPLE